MKHAPRAAAFLLLCAFAICLGSVAIASESGSVVWEEGGTVYTRPDFKSEVQNTLTAGTPVEVVGSEEYFLQIEYYDLITDARRTGWIWIVEVASSASAAPTEAPPPAPTPAPKAIGTGLVICESLTMRTAPDTTADRILTISYETKFNILAEKGDWYHIYYGGRDGYVQSTYAIMNPVYFIAVEQTPAYAYPSLSAKRVALLEPNTQLPIIAEVEGYYVVSLRGASAFVEK